MTTRDPDLNVNLPTFTTAPSAPDATEGERIANSAWAQWRINTIRTGRVAVDKNWTAPEYTPNYYTKKGKR